MRYDLELLFWSTDFLLGFNKSLVIRQKGESQNGSFKITLLTLGGKKCSLFGKFGVLCFLGKPVLRIELLLFSLKPVGGEGLCKI